MNGVIERAKKEMVERRVLVDRYTWSTVVYQASKKGRRGTRVTAGEMLRKGAKGMDRWAR